MALEKPLQLIRFISDIKVLEDGTVPLDYIDSDPFVSELYEPTYSLSVLARITQSIINSGGIKPTSHELGENTIVHQAINTDLRDEAPEVYLLLKLTVLESFSLVYHIDESRKDLMYVSARDIRIMKNNISYITDYLGTRSKYHHMIETMRDMHVSLGYIEHQIGVIVNEREVR